MKKFLNYMCAICAVLMCGIFLSACGEGDKVYSITLPAETAEYSVYSTGMIEDSSLSVSDRQLTAKSKYGYTLRFVFDNKYDLASIAIKANGVVIPHTTEPREYEEKTDLIVSSPTITENLTFTVENIKIKKLNFSFASATIVADGADVSTAVADYKHIDKLTFKIDNVEYTADQLIKGQAFAKQPYGSKIKIFAKSSMPNMFFVNNFRYLLYTSENNFNGVFAKDQFGNANPYRNNKATFVDSVSNESLDPIPDENWWYEYNYEIKEDSVIYLNNLDLIYNTYRFNTPSSKYHPYAAALNNTYEIYTDWTKTTSEANEQFDCTKDFIIYVRKKIDTQSIDGMMLAINGTNIIPNGTTIIKETIAAKKPLYTGCNINNEYGAIKFTFKGGNFTPSMFGDVAYVWDSNRDYFIDVKNAYVSDGKFGLNFTDNRAYPYVEVVYAGRQTATKPENYTNGTFYYNKVEAADACMFKINLGSYSIPKVKCTITKADGTKEVLTQDKLTFTQKTIGTGNPINNILSFSYNGDFENVNIVID